MVKKESLTKLLNKSLFILLVQINFSVQARTITFDTSIAQDASLSLVTAFKNHDDVNEIIFEKGTYHFYPNKAYELYRHISNHDDQLIRTPFPIINFNKLVIDGQGSDFIFHGLIIPFIIDGSQNITIKNLTINWATPFHSEGKVVAVDSVNKTYDLQYSKDFPYEIRNGEIFFIKEYYEHTLGQSILFNPITNAVAYNTEKFSQWYTPKRPSIQYNINQIEYPYQRDIVDPGINKIGRELKSFFEEIEPGIVRVHNHDRRLPQPGLVMVSKGAKASNRVAPAFHITSTTNLFINNVTVFHAGGMGIIAENCKDIVIDNYDVTPPNNRMISTTADACHFIGCRGELTIRNCNFKNQLDDACNIHGAYMEIIDIIDSVSLGIRIGHFQQKGFLLGIENDTIGLIRKEKSLNPYENIILDEIININGRYRIVKSKHPLPPKIQIGDLIENMDTHPNVLIENCVISNNRARGLLIGTRKEATIRNCYFHTQMTAILMPALCDSWYEASKASNLTIENNIFQDCAYGGLNQGCIQFITGKGAQEYVFNNIAIINNVFNHFDALILDINNVHNLIFTGNRISKTNTFAPLYPNNPAIKINSSENVVFKNNAYNGINNYIHDSDNANRKLTFK